MLENDTLNQEIEVEDDGLFDDFGDDNTIATPSVEDVEPENVAEEPEKVAPTVENEPEKVEQSTDLPFLTIRYDKEDVNLTRDEAIELSQKGKNYDRLYERYNSMNGELERLASMNNMDVNTYINSLNETQIKFEINKEMHSLQEKFPDTEEEVLKELATERVNSRMANIENKARIAEQEEVNAQSAEIRRQLNLFKTEYPNLEPDKLDKGVYDLVKGGYTLLEAYNKWARAEEEKNRPAMEAKAKVDKLNSDNKAKSYGSTTNVGVIETDDFMSGWNED